jgi:hypothetical protein
MPHRRAPPTYGRRRATPRKPDDRWSVRAVSYRGYILTPQSFRFTNSFSRNGAWWSVGVLIRTASQGVADNRYFGMTLEAARSKRKALDEGLKFGRRIVERELLKSINDARLADRELAEK